VDYDLNNPTVGDVPRTIDGGDGDDLFKGMHGVDTIDGGGGSDIIDSLGGADTLIGGSGDDELAPGCLEVGFEGSGGICTGDGTDTVDGGAGVDELSYWNTSQPVTVTLGAGGAETTANGAAGDSDHVSGIENVEGTREAANTITGNEQANSIVGNKFADTINAGAGDDDIEPGENFGNPPVYFDANDVIDGGPGVDRVVYERIGAVHIALADPGSPPTTGNGGGSESDSIANVEDVLSGDGGDTVTGNSDANRIGAGSGADVIGGRGGNDTLIARGGADTVNGGAGDDNLDLDEDGEADTATCGDGTDTVTADAIDHVAADCEIVNGVANGGGTPTGGGSGTGGGTTGTGGGTTGSGGTPSGGGSAAPPAVPFPGFTAFSSGLAGVDAFKAAATRTGKATVPPAGFDAYGLACAQACSVTLAGKLTLAKKASATAAKAKAIKLKTAKLAGGPGKPVRVKVALPAKAVRSLKRARKGTLKLVTTISSGGKKVKLPATIRLKAKR
jgi:Ca2+-binding RTX toxin-like protein